MNKASYNPKILILYGPNLNLLGRLNKNQPNIDKLNKQIRKKAKDFGLKVIIFQSNEEGRATTLVQRQRKKIKGIILFPGPWKNSGHVLFDALEILKIPYVTVSEKTGKTIFQGTQNIINNNFIKAVDLAFKILKEEMN